MRASKNFPKNPSGLGAAYYERDMRWRKMARCYWCNIVLTDMPFSPDMRTREHLLPKSLGGQITDENLVAACFACNQRRGNDTSWVPYSDVSAAKRSHGKRRQDDDLEDQPASEDVDRLVPDEAVDGNSNS